MDSLLRVGASLSNPVRVRVDTGMTPAPRQH